MTPYHFTEHELDAFIWLAKNAGNCPPHLRPHVESGLRVLEYAKRETK